MSEHPIHAEVRPCEGKHYGTDIAITHPSGRRHILKVWFPGGRPSDEELEDWGVTPEQWRANIPVDDGWYGTEPIQRLFPSDNHYQSAFEKFLADRIAAALDGLVWSDDV